MVLEMHHVHDPSKLPILILKMLIFIILCVDVNLIQYSVINFIKNLLNEDEFDPTLFIHDYHQLFFIINVILIMVHHTWLTFIDHLNLPPNDGFLIIIFILNDFHVFILIVFLSKHVKHVKLIHCYSKHHLNFSVFNHSYVLLINFNQIFIIDSPLDATMGGFRLN